MPGTIVTPALLEMVRKARVYGLRMARAIKAQDDSEQVTAWVEVEPEGDGALIRISDWHAEPLESTAKAEPEGKKLALLRHTAGLSARLGPSQEVLTVDADAPDLEVLADRRGLVAVRYPERRKPPQAAALAPARWRLRRDRRLRPGLECPSCPAWQTSTGKRRVRAIYCPA